MGVTAQQNIKRPGYKQTEVGVIPEVWVLRRLGDIASVAAGGTPSRKIPAYWNGDIPWVTTSQIDFNTITNAEQYITELGLKNSATKLLAPGTLLLALYGQGKTRGKVGQLGIRATTNQACASIVICSTVSRAYVFHFLASQYDAIRGLSNSGSQENLNGLIVKSIPIPLPPTKAEQEAIAETLDDADALIESLEQIIAKKRHLKQGAMQQLLTGKRRLPGFSGEWEVRRLGDIARLYQPITISQAMLKDDGYLVYGANGIIGRYDKYNHETWQAIITCRGSTCGTVSKTEDKAWITGNAMVVNCDDNKDIVKLFLFYLLAFQDFSLCITGSGQPQIIRGPLFEYSLRLPLAFDEQRAIATVLSDMDTDIAALEARHDKVRALKQGMMQQLLTGKIRLI